MYVKIHMPGMLSLFISHPYSLRLYRVLFCTWSMICFIFDVIYFYLMNAAWFHCKCKVYVSYLYYRYVNCYLMGYHTLV